MCGSKPSQLIFVQRQMTKGYVVVLATPNKIVLDCTLNFVNFIYDYPAESKSLLFCQGVSECEKAKMEIDEVEQPSSSIKDIIDLAHAIANKHSFSG